MLLLLLVHGLAILVSSKIRAVVVDMGVEKGLASPMSNFFRMSFVYIFFLMHKGLVLGMLRFAAKERRNSARPS
jgi:hypothetical protein